MPETLSGKPGIYTYAVRFAVIIIALLLGYSFWTSERWLMLCAGLALFLFGMQCLEDGLRNLAGGALERLLSQGTSTSLRSLCVGLFGATAMQSSTLVSLMTIAFITTGLIAFQAGVAIIIGANLGSATGIWLLALAGQNFSLSGFALPLLVFGIICSFFGPRARAAGRILLGIAFIFLGIEEIKQGFSALTQTMDFSQYRFDGWQGRILFTVIGLVLTLLLQSTHATLMLTLTALGLGQIELVHGAAIAVGANVGSSITTAVAGALSGNRSGQRLALAHVIFNVTTAILTFLLLGLFISLAVFIAAFPVFDSNELITLAIFNSLFNILGAVIFYPAIKPFSRLLERLLPDRPEPRNLITEQQVESQNIEVLHARYLTDQALSSRDAAAAALVQELEYLGRLSIEVICHALFLPTSQLNKARPDEELLRAKPDDSYRDADMLYNQYIKGIYSDILSFIGRIDMDAQPNQQEFWITCQMAAMQMAEAVKDAKHLQKNLRQYLSQPDSPARDAYVTLRRHLIEILHDVRLLGRADATGESWEKRLQTFREDVSAFDTNFSSHLFADVRGSLINGMQLSSLTNDLGYARRIAKSLDTLLVIRRQSSEGPMKGPLSRFKLGHDDKMDGEMLAHTLP